MFKRKLTALLLVLALCAGALTISAIADAGNFTGGSDYGGSDWGGGSSDWGSSDWGDSSDWDSDWDDSSYGGGSNYFFGGFGGGSGGGGGGGLSIGFFAVVILIVIVVGMLMAKRSISAHGSGNSVTTAVNTAPPPNLRPMSELRGKDPNFSEDALKEKISNLYVQMQHAWQDKDFEPMRPHMTDSLYSQFDRQLQELVKAGQTNYVQRIAVLGVTLEGWTEDETNQSISALVNTRIVDFTKDDKTDRIVNGSDTAEKFMCYRWQLIRSAGMTTPESAGTGSEGTTSLHCPSCGAPLDVNHSARCPYCDSIISSESYDWCISSITGISQRTGR